MNRRHWLRLATGCMFGGAGGQAVAGSPQNLAKVETALSRTAEAELEGVREQLAQAKIGPLNTARSVHYQAIGDASEWFMNVVLGDCEQIALDYSKHFRALGFQVRLPGSPLIVVVFRDDRSFNKFFHLPSLPEAGKKGLPAQLVGGIYDRRTNALHVFDWRSVGSPHSGRSQHAVPGSRSDTSALVQHRAAQSRGRHAALHRRGPGHLRRIARSHRPQ